MGSQLHVFFNPYSHTHIYYNINPPPHTHSLDNGFNPILTGLFESKFLQISAPKGPIATKFCMDVKTHLKSIATKKKLPKMVYLLYYYNLCKLDACYHKFIKGTGSQCWLVQNY